jgi:hypothetical protein
MVSPAMLDDLKQMRKPSVSIGFFYKLDRTPGEWNGDSFDYVQRELMHDHLAFGIDVGRCPWPQCGIGADEMLMNVACDPFAGYETFSDCVNDIMEKNPDYTREQAQATCAKIEKQSKEKDNTPLSEVVNMQPSTEEALTSAIKLMINDVLTEILHKNVEDTVEEEEKTEEECEDETETGSGGEEPEEVESEETESDEEKPCTGCDSDEEPEAETPVEEDEEESTETPAEETPSEPQEAETPETPETPSEPTKVDIVAKAKKEIEKTKEFLKEME